MSPLKLAIFALNRILLASLLGLGIPAAKATPIPFANGMLEGVFRTYDRHFENGVVTLIPKHEYVLGVEFIPGVPESFTNPAAPHSYSAVMIPPPPLAFAKDLSPNGVGNPLGGWILGGPGTLGDACDASTIPTARPVFLEVGLIAARGNCTFDQKWTNMEGAGWGAGILVNNVPGALNFLGGITSAHTIPFVLITQEAGELLRQGSTIEGPTIGTGHGSPVFDMAVTWTPNPTAVPEPGSLALLILGLVYLAVAGRRRLTLTARA